MYVRHCHLPRLDRMSPVHMCKQTKELSYNYDIYDTNAYQRINSKLFFLFCYFIVELIVRPRTAGYRAPSLMVLLTVTALQQ